MLSPGARPVVSSYTWMMALSPESLMVSPTRRTSPTRTSSSIMASVTPVASMTGPLTRRTCPMILSSISRRRSSFGFPSASAAGAWRPGCCRSGARRGPPAPAEGDRRCSRRAGQPLQLRAGLLQHLSRGLLANPQGNALGLHFRGRSRLALQARGLLGALASGLLQELGGLPRGGRAPLRGGLLGLLHHAPGLGLGVLGDALDQPALAHSLIPMAWLTISRMFARPATGPRRSGTSTMRGKLRVNI